MTSWFILPACHFLISEFPLPYYILCTLCVLLYLVYFSALPLSLFLFLHTISLIICFFVRFSTPFPASTTLPAHPFTYDSSHPPPLRTLFHTIPCLFHSSGPSFYVRFLSPSASSYAQSTSHQYF